MNLNGLKQVAIDPRRKHLRPNVPMKIAKSFSQLLRASALLAAAMTNQNISKLHNKTIRLASPRFLSLFPDHDAKNTVTFLPHFNFKFEKSSLFSGCLAIVYCL